MLCYGSIYHHFVALLLYNLIKCVVFIYVKKTISRIIKSMLLKESKRHRI